jgi:hypothetical protein
MSGLDDLLRTDALRMTEDWAGATPFHPAVHDGESFHDLPRPVLAVRVREAWDFERRKVPLADGDESVGHSRDGVDIVVSGRIGPTAADPDATALDLLAAVETLRQVLHVGGESAKYDFYLEHDATAGIYRHFKSCSTVRLEYDLSDKSLLEYTAVIHADDPTLYQSGPE